MGKLFDVSLVFSSIPELLTKLPITLELAVVSMLIGLGLGLVMAIIKMKKIRVLTQITNLLISLLRGTPVIVQLYVAFFGIPMMFKAINQQFGTNLAVANISGFVYAMIALGLNQSGFMAEIIRSALQSVDPGQIEAAHALGMTYPQTLRRIILPEALRLRFRPLETLLSVSSKERLLLLPAPLSRLPHRARLLEEERIATLKFTFHWLSFTGW